MNTVTWGMIGCGAVTEKKSGPALYKAQRSSLRGVFAPHRERAESFAARHGVPLVYATAEAMLADPHIDAVYIATPPNVHKYYALACLDAGKIPYIEKPMALSASECEEILDRSVATGLPVYVAYYRRGMEKYLTLRRLIRSGLLGTIQAVQARQVLPPAVSDRGNPSGELPWRLQPSISGGGKFVDMGTHLLDLLQFFFGDIVDAKGIATNRAALYPAEDTVGAVLQCASGVVTSALWCYVADSCPDCAQDELLIFGSRGSVRTAALSCSPVYLTVGHRTETLSFHEPEHVAQPYVQTIVDELTGHGSSAADARSAANVTRVVDMILAEYRRNSGGMSR